MHKRLTFIPLSFASVLLAATLLSNNAAAFNRGDVMSNAVYLNKNSMTQKQIQNFLESKKSSLATYKDKGPNESKKMPASYLIWHAAQIWHINPQVILTTLQKENSLITMQNPESWRYRTAMGYGCPDGGDCNAMYYGFGNQVNIATYQFRYNYEALLGHDSFKDIDGDSHPVGTFACAQADDKNSPPFYNKGLLPGNKVTFARNTDISGTKSATLTIANEATASFYCYTPHSGPYNTTGYSGSDNLVTYFTQWFGSTHYVVSGSIKKYYDANNGPILLGEATDYMRSNGHGFYWQKFENGYIAGQANTGYYAVKGSIGIYYGSHNGPSVLGKPLGTEKKDAKTGIWSQDFANGKIIGHGGTGYFSILDGASTYYQKSGGIDKYGQPLAERKSIGSGAYEQQFQNGYIVGSKAVGYYESSGPIRSYWINHGSTTGRLGLPTSNISIIGDGDGTYQLYQGGVIIGNTSIGYYAVKGAIGKTYLDNLVKHFDYLGFPLSNEHRSDGAYEQQFQNGYITGNSGRYYRTSNEIYNYWETHGAASGRLGLPMATVATIGGGEYQAYIGGAVIGSPSTGYYSTKGSIGKTYLSNISKYYKDLGFPLANESKVNGVWQQQFEKGYIVGVGGHYYESYGAIRDRWNQLGGWNGSLGPIIADYSSGSRGMTWQKFKNGYIVKAPSSNKAWESKGSIRAYWASTGYQSGKFGFPTGPETKHSDGSWSQQYENGTIRTLNGKNHGSTLN